MSKSESTLIEHSAFSVHHCDETGMRQDMLNIRISVYRVVIEKFNNKKTLMHTVATPKIKLQVHVGGRFMMEQPQKLILIVCPEPP